MELAFDRLRKNYTFRAIVGSDVDTPICTDVPRAYAKEYRQLAGVQRRRAYWDVLTIVRKNPLGAGISERRTRHLPNHNPLKNYKLIGFQVVRSGELGPGVHPRLPLKEQFQD